MDDFKARLLSEHFVLTRNTDKLSDFMLTQRFDAINSTQRYLLRQQLSHMKNYREVLRIRMDDAGITGDEIRLHFERSISNA